MEKTKSLLLLELVVERVLDNPIIYAVLIDYRQYTRYVYQLSRSRFEIIDAN